MRIRYVDHLAGIAAVQLEGFFVGWPNPPSPATHLELLNRSDAIELALDDDDRARVVGFITAISDGVLSACIPLLEVLPECRGNGIGRELVKRMLARLQHLYMVDLSCDARLQPFYASLGFRPATGMMLRNYRIPVGS
ncbi:MAG: GNAT family N-acetyltransferase [Planctomycetota bacterium]